MWNLESSPLFLTKSLKTPSAAGLRQMFPKHTKRTEKGLFSVVEEAIDDDDEALIMGLILIPTGQLLNLRFWRDGHAERGKGYN